MNILKKSVALCGIAAGAAAVALSAAPASALTASEYSNVRQWVCSENNATVDLTYVNPYGNVVNADRTRFVGGQISQDGRVQCIYKDLYAGKYGQYVSTTVVDETGGYVSCAIFVNGVKVSESSDNDDTFSWASCY